MTTRARKRIAVYGDKAVVEALGKGYFPWKQMRRSIE
jgi:hypothetical protein